MLESDSISIIKFEYRFSIVINSWSPSLSNLFFFVVLFLFLDSFLNSCGCSTAKSKTPPQGTIFFTNLPVQSLGPNHP